MKILYCLIKKWYSYVQGILFVFVISALYSCVSLKKIGIEVAVVPEYPIAEDIQSLVLLNRSMTNQFTNNKVDTLEKILINKMMILDTVFQDSIAADTIIQIAAQALFQSERFDVVVPKDRNIVRTDSKFIANPLNISFINEVCTDFKVDAVLILESFAERLGTKYSEIENNYSGFNGYSAATDITYKSEWRLYRPDNLKRVIRFQIIDSIFWQDRSSSLEYLYIQMPKIKAALIGGGIAAGLKIADYISPKWINQKRYYYLTGKNEIDAAIPLIKNNKWEEAAAIWAKYASINSKTIRSKVEFNLALAAEMNGNTDLAIEWGIKSFKTRYTKAIGVYLKTLDNKRKAQQKENKSRY
ncbi:MAG: DUF6340 family protein [Bacteroidia bacterium]|nr:DUF6340 family protein [Bacteroidia bacterium]